MIIRTATVTAVYRVLDRDKDRKAVFWFPGPNFAKPVREKKIAKHRKVLLSRRRL